MEVSEVHVYMCERTCAQEVGAGLLEIVYRGFYDDDFCH